MKKVYILIDFWISFENIPEREITFYISPQKTLQLDRPYILFVPPPKRRRRKNYLIFYPLKTFTFSPNDSRDTFEASENLEAIHSHVQWNVSKNKGKVAFF